MSAIAREGRLTHVQPTRYSLTTDYSGFFVVTGQASETEKPDEDLSETTISSTTAKVVPTARRNRFETNDLNQLYIVPTILPDEMLQLYNSALINPMYELFTASSGYPITVVLESSSDEAFLRSIQGFSVPIEGNLYGNHLITGSYTGLTFASAPPSTETKPTDIFVWNADESATVFSTIFEKFRQQIGTFQFLPIGWDTYKAKPLTVTAVENARKLVDRLEEAGIVPDLVLPTSDNSIFVRFSKGNYIFEYELFSDGENAKVRIDGSGHHEYFDVSTEELSAAL